jgi:hypothetical protein
MADASLQAQTYTNAGVASAYNTTNYEKHVINQADVGRELIISVTKSGSGNLTDAILKAVRAQLTLAGGDRSGTDVNGPDAFAVVAVGTANGAAFVSGTTTVVYFRVQGTGTPNTTTVDSATVAVVATFTPNL